MGTGGDASLTPRERVLTALEHCSPDRVPIVIGASNATGISIKAYRRLKEYLKVESPDRYLYEWPELGAALPDEQVLQRLKSDVRGVHDRLPAETYQRNRKRLPGAPFIDDWGSGQLEVEPGVWYPGVHPLKDGERIEEIDHYPWPDMHDPTRIAHVRQAARQLAEDGQFAILATPWLLFPLERAIAMQGMDRFLSNMALNPEFASALLLKILDLCKTLMGNFLDALDGNVDIIKIGDDLGTQANLLISPQMYRRILKPIHADYIAFIKERTTAKIFFHTDGDVFDLLDDFVEIGIDILNPIQTSAGKMAHLPALKRRFGRDLSFCGAIDTQQLLPFGTPAQVRQEVRRVIQALGSGGGYLLAAVHTIGDQVPPENILAMVDAVDHA